MRQTGGAGFDPLQVLQSRYAQQLREHTVISATDGNYGRALAAAAASAGCPGVIVLHAQVNAEREAAIAACGARIVRVAGNYDAAHSGQSTASRVLLINTEGDCAGVVRIVDRAAGRRRATTAPALPRSR